MAIAPLNATYEGTLVLNNIVGLTQMGMSLSLNLSKGEKAEKPGRLQEPKAPFPTNPKRYFSKIREKISLLQVL